VGRRGRLAIGLAVVGAGVFAGGYLNPTMIGSGARPYAYISVMAIGAILIIASVLFWRER
jgi:hypothetical protein